MAQLPLPDAALRALQTVSQLRTRMRLAEVTIPSESVPSELEPQIEDEANWLDLNKEEQIIFDEKLSAFLDLEVENKERDWLLPTTSSD